MTDLKCCPADIEKSWEDCIIGVFSAGVFGFEALIDGDVAGDDEDKSKDIPWCALALN